MEGRTEGGKRDETSKDGILFGGGFWILLYIGHGRRGRGKGKSSI